jgi:hypothetical protein
MLRLICKFTPEHLAPKLAAAGGLVAERFKILDERGQCVVEGAVVVFCGLARSMPSVSAQST